MEWIFKQDFTWMTENTDNIEKMNFRVVGESIVTQNKWVLRKSKKWNTGDCVLATYYKHFNKDSAIFREYE